MFELFPVVLRDSDEVEVSAVSVLAAVDLLSVLVVVVVENCCFRCFLCLILFSIHSRWVQPANKKARPIVTKILLQLKTPFDYSSHFFILSK